MNLKIKKINKNESFDILMLHFENDYKLEIKSAVFSFVTDRETVLFDYLFKKNSLYCYFEFYSNKELHTEMIYECVYYNNKYMNA